MSCLSVVVLMWVYRSILCPAVEVGSRAARRPPKPPRVGTLWVAYLPGRIGRFQVSLTRHGESLPPSIEGRNGYIVPNMTLREHYTTPGDGTFYLTVSGSELYGTQVGGADRDEMGIFIEDPDCVTGLKTEDHRIERTQAAGIRSGEGDLDRTTYGLRKFARLAAAGNPTVLLLLFVPANKVLVRTPLSDLLVTNDTLFISKQAGARFLGYLDSQRNQLLGLTGRKHTNRPELVEKYGFDTKFAYHAVRLGLQGVELMDNAWIDLPMKTENRDLLLDIRTGVYTKSEVDQMITEVRFALQHAIEKSGLPEEPDRGGIDDLLHDMYLNTWSDRGYV